LQASGIDAQLSHQKSSYQHQIAKSQPRIIRIARIFAIFRSWYIFEFGQVAPDLEDRRRSGPVDRPIAEAGGLRFVDL
jgi:hypothetical protein